MGTKLFQAEEFAEYSLDELFKAIVDWLAENPDVKNPDIRVVYEYDVYSAMVIWEVG